MAGGIGLGSPTCSTWFAPAARADDESVQRAWDFLSSLPFAREVVNALPSAIAVLNRQRQLVFWNGAFLGAAGAHEVADVLGKRLGEALGCARATDHPSGCGASEACRHCGATQAILTCLATDRPAEKECRLRADVGGEPRFFDLKVTTRSFQVQEESFVIVTLTDISDTKRRRALERVFLHDVLNLASGLRGMVELMPRIADPERLQVLVKDLGAITDSLLDELVAQRELSAVESGEYRVRAEDLRVADLFAEVARHLRHHEAARSHGIVVEPVPGELGVRVDHTLVRRVLVNMLKNALEASPRGSDVSLSALPVAKNAGFVRLCVHNAGFMPRDEQLQLFQRSFSTKGSDRGLGTYSMKLFTEHYLGGSLRFVSTHETGTVFTAELPVSSTDEDAPLGSPIPGSVTR